MNEIYCDECKMAERCTQLQQDCKYPEGRLNGVKHHRSSGCTCAINWQRFYENQYREMGAQLHRQLDDKTLRLDIACRQIDAMKDMLAAQDKEMGDLALGNLKAQHAAAIENKRLKDQLLAENVQVKASLEEWARAAMKTSASELKLVDTCNEQASKIKKLEDQLSSAIKSYQETAMDCNEFKDEIAHLNDLLAKANNMVADARIERNTFEDKADLLQRTVDALSGHVKKYYNEVQRLSGILKEIENHETCSDEIEEISKRRFECTGK